MKNKNFEKNTRVPGEVKATENAKFYHEHLFEMVLSFAKEARCFKHVVFLKEIFEKKKRARTVSS